MYGLSNDMIANDIEWVWMSFLFVWNICYTRNL